MNIQVDRVLDAKGLACPMPIVKTKKTIGEMAVGAVLEIHTTDKGAVKDLSAWTHSTGNELLKHEEEAGVLKFWVRKGNK